MNICNFVTAYIIASPGTWSLLNNYAPSQFQPSFSSPMLQSIRRALTRTIFLQHCLDLVYIQQSTRHWIRHTLAFKNRHCSRGMKHVHKQSQSRAFALKPEVTESKTPKCYFSFRRITLGFPVSSHLSSPAKFSVLPDDLILLCLSNQLLFLLDNYSIQTIFIK